jgi:hypothetical protein
MSHFRNGEPRRLRPSHLTEPDKLAQQDLSELQMQKMVRTATALIFVAALAVSLTKVTAAAAQDGTLVQVTQFHDCKTLPSGQTCYVKFPKVGDGALLEINRIDCVTLGAKPSNLFELWLSRPSSLPVLNDFVGSFQGKLGRATGNGPYLIFGGQSAFVHGGGANTGITCSLTGLIFNDTLPNKREGW